MINFKEADLFFSIEPDDGLGITLCTWEDVMITPLDTFLEHSLADMPADMAKQYADRLEIFVKQLRAIE